MAREDLRLVEPAPAASSASRPGAAGSRAGRTSAEEGGGAELTIEELAREVGMTVRNIRAHQARGLLPPPEVRTRVGYYGPEHVARLNLIRELQADGFNLKGIKRLLEETHGPAERLLGFKRAVEAPFETEQPQVFTLEELRERFGAEVGPRTLRKAERLGALVPLGEGRYEAPSPSLLDAAEEAMRRGISLYAALSVVEKMQRSCESIAHRFVKLVQEEVWKPFEEAGYPEDRWDEVVAAIEALRPLGSRALLAVFQQTMTREVEGTFGREVRKRWRRR